MTAPKFFAVSLFALTLTNCTTPIDPRDYDSATLYKGASVWSEGQFIKTDFVVKEGRFITVPKHIIDNLVTVDLSGRFVTPPFGDGHTHQIEGTFALEEFNNQFLSQGVFYAQNPAGLPRLMKQAKLFTDRPDTIDVRYSMGVLTTPFGHPERGYVDFMTQYSYRGETRESFRGTAIHAVKTEADVKEAIDILTADGADFVKIILEFSREYDERSGRLEEIGEDTEDLDIYYTSGMDPDLAAITVKYAHAAGLPVKAHIKTIHDFRVAVAVGVDTLLHMPGAFPYVDTRLSDYELTEEDAKSAAEAGIDVVATTAVRLAAITSDRRPEVFALQKQNIRTLMDQGVSVLIGIDNYGETTRTEVNHLLAIGAMTPQEMLTALIATGQSIFPDRKIGQIAPNFEASFLVLDANPLEDFTTLDRIERRIKEGVEMSVVK